MLRCPDLNRYGLFDTKHHREIFEAGREAARAAMVSIQQALESVA